MHKYKLIRYIIGISVIALIIFPSHKYSNYVAAITSGLSPAPIDYLDNTFVDSVEFKRAIIGDFCEITIGTNECDQNTKSIIFGEAVLKYRSGFSKDPTQIAVSPPFGLFILDDEIYVTFVPSANFPSSFTNPEIADPEFNFTSRELEIGTRLLPDGLDRHRYFSYRIVSNGGEWKEIFLNLYTIDVRKEIGGISKPDPDGGPSELIDAFVVDSVIPHKKFKLVRVNKVLNDFVINLK